MITICSLCRSRKLTKENNDNLNALINQLAQRNLVLLGFQHAEHRLEQYELQGIRGMQRIGLARDHTI